ncbi:MAG TPA: DUF1569 domain-containing protein [Candidatus Sulfotelmatobacter sp.]|nr:DUF1569 domain-containing protein [Candidatus Sulfotelmatobacter sp.]
MDPLLHKLQKEIEEAIAGLSGSQLSRHPPGKWSWSEILEHLYLTYTGTTKGFERAAEAGEPPAAKQTWVQRGRTLVVLGFGYLPSGRESPAVALPRGLPPEQVRAGFAVKILEMDESIARCEQKFGTRRKLLDHPVLGPLTGAEWRKFHLVHGLHHVKQIRRLRDFANGK